MSVTLHRAFDVYCGSNRNNGTGNPTGNPIRSLASGQRICMSAGGRSAEGTGREESGDVSRSRQEAAWEQK